MPWKVAFDLGFGIGGLGLFKISGFKVEGSGFKIWGFGASGLGLLKISGLRV